MHKPCWWTTVCTPPMRPPNPSGVCLVKVAALLCDASPQLHSPNARPALREPTHNSRTQSLTRNTFLTLGVRGSLPSRGLSH
jgi:hypothetical protein